MKINKTLLLVLVSFLLIGCSKVSSISNVEALESVKEYIEVSEPEIREILIEAGIDLGNTVESDLLIDEIVSYTKVSLENDSKISLGKNILINIRSYDIARVIEKRSTLSSVGLSQNPSKEILDLLNEVSFYIDTPIIVQFESKDGNVSLKNKKEVANALLGDIQSYIEMTEIKKPTQNSNDVVGFNRIPQFDKNDDITTRTTVESPHDAKRIFKFKHNNGDVLSIKVNKILSGNNAIERLNEFSEFNKKPTPGFDYVIVVLDIVAEKSSGNTDVSTLDFTFYNRDRYENNKVIGLGLPESLVLSQSGDKGKLEVLAEIDSRDENLLFTFKNYEENFIYLTTKAR